MAGTGVRPPYLEIVEPIQLAGSTWALTGSTHILGRLGDIRLDSPDVSKRHAELRQGSDGVWLNDLGSRNGILHNGTPVPPGRPVHLAHGDELQVGSMRLTFIARERSVHNTATVTDVRDIRDARSARDSRHRGAPDLPPHPPHHAPPPPVEDDARTQTTRYLTAATQLDPAFADLVVRQVVDEPFRALAPVFGADLGIVTRWALAARRRRLARDLALLAVLATLVAYLGLRLHADWADIASGTTQDWWRQYVTVTVLLLAVAWLVIALDSWVTQHLVLRRRMTHGRFDPAHAPNAVSARARRRLDTVAERPSGNVIVCSDFWPFAGSGYLLDQWDTPIDIRRGAPLPQDRGGRRSAQRFTTGELYDVLVTAARRLGLANLRVEERLFVDGRNVARDRGLLPDPLRPPLSRIPVPVIRTMPDGLGATKRSYVSIEVPAWSGQLVLTMYLRAVQVEGTLYLEWSAHALLPMRRAYYGVDQLPRRTAVGALLRALGTALPRVPVALLGAPRALARRMSSDLAAAAHRGRQRRTIRGRYVFDYGAGASIREFACGEEFGHHFLDRDASRIVQTTEQHLMNTISDFLDARGVDSESFLRFQQHIFNDNRDYSFKAGNINNSGVLAQGQNARAGGAPRSGGARA